MTASDESLGRSIAKALAAVPDIDAQVSVTNGIVRLTGSAAVWDGVVDAGHAAAAVAGVRNVVNALEVPIPAKTSRAQKQALHHYNPLLPSTADVVIVGGGVVGCAIARELSRYALDIVLLEKEPDVCAGTSKANSGQVHTGVGERDGTLKKELCVEAWPRYAKLAEALQIPYIQNGLLTVITDDSLPSSIPKPLRRLIAKTLVVRTIMHRARRVGDTPRIVKKDELYAMEPNLTDRAIVGVFMPGYGITSPYKMTIALAENAAHNGALVILDTAVTGIRVENGKVHAVETTRGTIKTSWVINAAGVHADDVAAMPDAEEFTIHGRKGSIVLFDKSVSDFVRHQVGLLILPQPKHTKGGGALVTVDGNLNWGPTAVEVPDKEDTSVSSEELDAIFDKYSLLFPGIRRSDIITYFAGVRAATYKEDFVIKHSDSVQGLVHAAGIQSPGLTAAPVIAERVADILAQNGLRLEKRASFTPRRAAHPSFDHASTEEKKKLIAADPRYGTIVCRCEHVTEAEIVAAIHARPPALTVDAVKRRTRAGMGRCQGGFCGPRVAAIIARELGIPLTTIVKDSDTSSLFTGTTKSLLTSEESP